MDRSSLAARPLSVHSEATGRPRRGRGFKDRRIIIPTSGGVRMSGLRGRELHYPPDPASWNHPSPRTVVPAPAGCFAWILGWVAIFLVPSLCGAADSGRPSLESDVQPLLKARCIKCHAPLK